MEDRRGKKIAAQEPRTELEDLKVKMINKFTGRWKRFLKNGVDELAYIDRYLFCRIFGFSQQEFQRYHFENCFWKRFSFISNKHGKEIFEKYNKAITGKRDNYLLLSEYYQRDCCRLDAENPEYENERLLCSFAEKHRAFIAKAFEGAGGGGVKKYEAEQIVSSAKTFLEIYPFGCLLEEIIAQTPEIAAVHPWSINTLRITIVNCNGHIEAIYPVMRFGTGKKFIDNDQFGLLCAVDEQTEKIISAMDLAGRSYNIHPDTGAMLIGFHVPELKSAIELAKKLVLYFPKNMFTGFDFAHTKDGWILVEANTLTSFTIWQLPYQKGFRKEMRKIEKEYKRSVGDTNIMPDPVSRSGLPHR